MNKLLARRVSQCQKQASLAEKEWIDQHKLTNYLCLLHYVSSLTFD
jgi:hypothetical protein